MYSCTPGEIAACPWCLVAPWKDGGCDLDAKCPPFWSSTWYFKYFMIWRTKKSSVDNRPDQRYIGLHLNMKHLETQSESGFNAACCVERKPQQLSKICDWEWMPVLWPVLVIYGASKWQKTTGWGLLMRLCCNLAKIKYQFKGQLSVIFTLTRNKTRLTGA